VRIIGRKNSDVKRQALANFSIENIAKSTLEEIPFFQNVELDFSRKRWGIAPIRFPPSL
jgi:hypothetical protein